MDLTYGPEYEAFREEVRAFLRARWHGVNDADDIASFRKSAIDAGYLYRSIPRCYGGSEQPTDVLRARVIREEFTAAHAPMELRSLGTQLLVPTLLEAGTSSCGRWARNCTCRRCSRPARACA